MRLHNTGDKTPDSPDVRVILYSTVSRLSFISMSLSFFSRGEVAWLFFRQFFHVERLRDYSADDFFTWRGCVIILQTIFSHGEVAWLLCRLSLSVDFLPAQVLPPQRHGPEAQPIPMSEEKKINLYEKWFLTYFHIMILFVWNLPIFV
jgi:hypothetical protein